MITVAIPYLDSGAQGAELEFAILGWLNYFQEEFRLIVIGDRHPAIDKYGVVFIPCPRIEPVEGQYLPALDVVNKMLTLREHTPGDKDFIWSNDDIYAVNNFDLTDVKFLKCLGHEMPGNAGSKNGWLQIMARTKDALIKETCPTINYSTHLPQYYEWDKMLALIDKFDMRHVGYSFINMYYNYYYPDRVPFVLDQEKDNIKFGIYGSDIPDAKIWEMFSKKIWLNNSVDGWTANLQRILYRFYKEY